LQMQENYSKYFEDNHLDSLTDQLNAEPQDYVGVPDMNGRPIAEIY